MARFLPEHFLCSDPDSARLRSSCSFALAAPLGQQTLAKIIVFEMAMPESGLGTLQPTLTGERCCSPIDLTLSSAVRTDTLREATPILIQSQPFHHGPGYCVRSEECMSQFMN